MIFTLLRSPAARERPTYEIPLLLHCVKHWWGPKERGETPLMVNFIASTDILKGSIVLGKKHNVMHTALISLSLRGGLE